MIAHEAELLLVAGAGAAAAAAVAVVAVVALAGQLVRELWHEGETEGETATAARLAVVAVVVVMMMTHGTRGQPGFLLPAVVLHYDLLEDARGHLGLELVRVQRRRAVLRDEQLQTRRWNEELAC